MEVTRAYSALEIKSVSEDKRIIEGIASTPRPDRHGDVVVPEGAKFTLPLPLLLDHIHTEAVGEVEFAEVTPKGIKFRAHIKTIDEPGEVKDLVDKAWQLAKSGLRRFVSIGFRPLEDGYERIATGLKFTSWEWLELSMVTVPAQPDASFQAKSLDEQIEIVKDFDRRRLAAIHANQSEPEPAATGNKGRVVRLDAPARDRAKPFVIRSIKRTSSNN